MFNATDDCLALFIDQNEFDESLLLNTLFQDQILVHESNFFNSTLLAAHIKQARGEPSLFELTARRGLIVPAFRNPGTQSLEQAYEGMKTVYGKSYDLLHPDLQPFRDRLIASIDTGLKHAKPFYWPGDERDSLGERYHRLVCQLFQTQNPPSYTQGNPDREQIFARVWEKSKEWRFECVEEAAECTRRKGARGLQRLELFRSIGRRLGVPENQYKVYPMDIISRCEGEEALAMEIFLKWVTQCYHLNQAQSFGTSINFPVYNLNQDFIMDTLTRSPLDAKPSRDEGFRCAVELPPLGTLLQTSADDLVAIRSDLGLGYFKALERWQNDPSYTNQDGVERSLRDYCEQICVRYERGVREPFVASFGRGTALLPELGRDTLVAAVSLSVPGLFVQMTKAINVIFRYIRRKRAAQKTACVSREMEITLPSE